MSIIYKHTNKINGKAYIGQTIKTMSQRSGKNGIHYLCNPNARFSKAIKKYGWENFKTEILEENIPEKLLNEREIYWINHFNTYKSGYNCTIGGVGFRCKHSNETKEKIRNKLKGRKMSKAWAAIRVPVIQYSIDGNYIQEFNSIALAASTFNTSQSNIMLCCQGKTKYAVNNIWVYKGDELLLKERVKFAKTPRADSFSVQQIDKDTGCIVDTYQSILEAHKITNITVSNIARVAKGERKTAGGFIWRFN